PGRLSNYGQFARVPRADRRRRGDLAVELSAVSVDVEDHPYPRRPLQVVHKLSEVTPLNTLLFADIASAAGVPAGVYNAVVGTGPNIGQPWSVTPDVNMVRSREDGGGAARIRTLRGLGQEE